MPSLNKIIIIGHVGRDAEVRTFESGNKIATFTVAVSERFTDRNNQPQEITEWFSVVANGKLAEFAEGYIRKGASVYVEGKQRTRSYTDASGVKKSLTELSAQTIQLLSPKPQVQDPYLATAQAMNAPAAPQRPVPPMPGAPAPSAPQYQRPSAPAPQYAPPVYPQTPPPPTMEDAPVNDLPF